MRHTKDSITLYILITCLITIPLPPIHNQVITYLLLAFAIFPSVLIKSQVIYISIFKIKTIALLFIIVAAWILFQAVPNNPIHHPLWQSASQILQTDSLNTISVTPNKTLIDLLKIMTYGGAFWLSMQLGSNQKYALIIIHTIIIVGLLYTFYGFIIYTTNAKQILWYTKTAYLDSFTSTFPNRNTYATYAAMCSMICIVIFMQRIRSGFTSNGFFVYVNLISLLTTALILTNSRAGISSFIIGLFAICILVLITQTFSESHSKKKLITVSLIFILIFLTYISYQQLQPRLTTLPQDVQLRLNIYKITLQAIKQHIITGSGLGSFENIFAMHRDGTLSPWLSARIDHAHNTYLEIFLELGAIPSLLLFSIYICIICHFISRIKSKEEGTFASIGLITIVIVATHALFDFSIEIPAIAFTFHVILGVCYAQSFPKKYLVHGPIQWQDKTPSILGVLGILCGAALLFNQVLYDDSKHTLNKTHMTTTTTKQELQHIYQYTKKGLNKSPADSQAWLQLAHLGMRLNKPNKTIVDYLYMSTITGPHTKHILFYRLQLAISLWQYLNAAQQQEFIKQIEIAMIINHNKTIDILSYQAVVPKSHY